MVLTDPLPIQPFTRPVNGSVVLPGSKSLTNRALLLAALCDGPVALTGALFSEDTEIMAEALKALGFTIELRAEKNEIYVEGRGGKIPKKEATLHVGLAGTAARFLTALCAAAPDGVYRIDGVAQMRKRPMKGLFDALERQGAKINYLGQPGFFPIELHAHGLRGGEVEIDASESSQMLSALLMVAPLARTNVFIKLTAQVREPFVEMTLNLMEHFGVSSGSANRENAQVGFHVPAARYSLAGATNDSIYPIEPDATAASYFLALPLVTRGTLTLKHITGESLQGDVRFADVLRRAGLSLSIESASFVASHDNASLHGVTQDFSEFSDTFLTLAAIAPLFDGPTLITGIAHTRKQETDRVAGMARELFKLKQLVGETTDSLAVTPDLAALKNLTARGPIEIETYGDHRFAMSFGILGCHDLHGDGRPWLTIKNPACCAKTFPDFFEELARLHAASHNVRS